MIKIVRDDIFKVSAYRNTVSISFLLLITLEIIHLNISNGFLWAQDFSGMVGDSAQRKYLSSRSLNYVGEEL